MRIVFDSNTYISALVFGGRPALLLRMAEDFVFELLISPTICNEVEEVLARKFKLSEPEIIETCSPVWQLATMVVPKCRISACTDPDDNRILECAVEGKADFIITGDAHLLKIGRLGEIRVIRTDIFLRQMSERGFSF
jgi:putative PIN family toxin of toxin-antitoxin system